MNSFISFILSIIHKELTIKYKFYIFKNIKFINFYSLSLNLFYFFSILAELDDTLGNLAKTHIFTLLYPTNPISHLGRSQFFSG